MLISYCNRVSNPSAGADETPILICHKVVFICFLYLWLDVSPIVYLSKCLPDVYIFFFFWDTKLPCETCILKNLFGCNVLSIRPLGGAEVRECLFSPALGVCDISQLG